MALAMVHPLAFEEEASDDLESFIARVGGALSELERRGDAASWEKARIVIDADAEASTHPEFMNKTERERHQGLNKRLRKWWDDRKLPAPRASVFIHARKLYATWDDIFVGVNPNNFQYDIFRRIAVSNLEKSEKDALRTWYEATGPTQREVRDAIREKVDASMGVYRPDFDLKVSNHWVFQSEKRDDGFDGGVNYELYANLIHLYSDAGDTILDPFAGGGILADTLKRYKHFQRVTDAAYSGVRHALMSDIAPRRDDIAQGDARSALPFPHACADLVIIDPPYFRISAQKYAGLGATLDEWLEGMRQVLMTVKSHVTPGGFVAVMSDDVVRKVEHQPMSWHLFAVLHELGYVWHNTIYNFNRNFLGMSPMEMSRAKGTRLLVNAMKIIQIASVA